ncbi:uncharacterized protein LOC134230186 [Saccostrea cucullata]|uniref:uncharacterized protein LOC134230186 n=1 Tax=Saccostrea cuccullata TaxID=36930 RepID=UPI002ED2BA5B
MNGLNLNVTILTVFLCVVTNSAIVVDVSYKNFNKVRKDEPFSVFLMVAKNCEKCRLLYPKFVASSQAFKDDSSVLFGRVKDTKLASEWDVTSFPSLVFFEKGGKHPMRNKGDITVDTVTEYVSKALGKDTTAVRRHYTTELTTTNFYEILAIPRQFKFLLLYKREHEEEVARIERFAEIFKKDDILAFLRLDVLREPNLAAQFETRLYPALYWYSDDERPTKARYGGKIDDIQLLEFIKDQTGIQRTKSGALVENAGRLADLDDFISEKINLITKAKNMDKIIAEAKKRAAYHKKDLAKYYIYLLKEIKKAKTIDVLDDERAAINRALSEDPGPKTSEALIKMRNIIHGIIDATGADLHKSSGDSQFVMNREAREVKLNIDEEVVYLDNGEEFRATGDGRTVKVKKKGKQKKKAPKKDKEHQHLHDEL